jgi:anti-anti-sigma factor
MGEALWVRAEADGRCRVGVVGEFDLAVEEPFVELVAAQVAAGHDKTLIDLGGVEFIDSSGVRALMRVHLEYPGRVELVAVHESVRRVLTVAGLAKVLIAEGARE